ncbi:Zinc finger, N-recognin [Cordyceps fumosorosea ARSEF 2679]|uniref:Zinc finger, N-recognin n=1 Tax=Cordyceps fumosorosea (strain ARSEF 2679) TaxID=1081104 RepID=A0A167XJ16_CORFA|nr:Zinc finger, N-recognin [Cordyceps fumosorosea ARSEF 2679]OAA65031.1 Zinc finger, N-recognin [Cordyceps fumosorosea ARSEF 2679]
MSSNGAETDVIAAQTSKRSNSFSNQSDTSQTAAEFIRNQELLEADAREALPFSIDNCTRILGPLKQSIFACLTCNPAPATEADSWTPAGVCYSCSVQCHGEHTLVEIFQKRNFTCDCGTTRLPSTSPCELQTNDETNTRGNVHSQEPDVNNKYNKNFRNRFCACACDYDPFEQKGTMFQCLGLGTEESGGCGEDWYHPGCLVGMGPKWYETMTPKGKKSHETREDGSGLAVISEVNEDERQPENEGKEMIERNTVEEDENAVEDDEDPPMPPGFPEEEDFDGFLCYKCVESNPWIKKYAGTSGFLPALHLDPAAAEAPQACTGNKRKAGDDEEHDDAKRVKTEAESASAPAPAPITSSELTTATSPSGCKLPNFAAAPTGRFSLFFKEDFRKQFCRCTDCFGKLHAFPQLLEEEEVYEPPMSDGGGDAASRNGGGSTAGSGSLLERGESALRNVDRVRAIEGVMAYNHLKERLKPFFQQFAESGQAVGAEDIKAYFAKLRGDEQAIRDASEGAAAASGSGSGSGQDGGGGDARREQGGY